SSSSEAMPPSAVKPTDLESTFVAIDDMKEAVEAYEKRILEAALAKSRYNQRQTAKALNLTYDQLRHSLKRHDLLG
ncbi:Psp operon transcriptional activator, partial [hydrothermal vent metagenome]